MPSLLFRCLAIPNLPCPPVTSFQHLPSHLPPSPSTYLNHPPPHSTSLQVPSSILHYYVEEPLTDDGKVLAAAATVKELKAKKSDTALLPLFLQWPTIPPIPPLPNLTPVVPHVPPLLHVETSRSLSSSLPHLTSPCGGSAYHSRRSSAAHPDHPRASHRRALSGGLSCPPSTTPSTPLLSSPPALPLLHICPSSFLPLNMPSLLQPLFPSHPLTLSSPSPLSPALSNPSPCAPLPRPPAF